MFFNENPVYSDKPMIITDSGLKVTYNDLTIFCNNLSNHMEPRKLIFILCENSPGSIMTYLSCLRIGVVPLLIDYNSKTSIIENLLEIYKPDYIAAPDSWNNSLIESDSVFSQYEYTLYKTNFNCTIPLNKDLALLLTTSGSTGTSKLVRQSYKNINSNAQSISKYLNLNENERPITILPMHYTYGLSIINSHVLCGATILVTKYTILDKGFWTFFKEYEATSISGVPYTYNMLKRLKFTDMYLPSLRTMTQAGGKLDYNTTMDFAKYALSTKKQFIVMYGQTEATARMSYLPSEYAISKCGSIGFPIPGGSFELVDDTGTVNNMPETPNELIYRGPNVTMGYSQSRLDLSKDDEFKGVLFTGDIAKKDSEGFYYIVGRKKRFIKIYGNRVNLDEIEQLLRNKFPQCDFVCTGVDDHLKIFTDSLIDHNSIISCIKECTNINIHSITVNTIDSIPKSSSGKILYSSLK